MKTLIEIDTLEIVLPASVNLGAIVKALSGAVRVAWDYHAVTPHGVKEYFIDGPVEIRISQVPDNRFKQRPGEANQAQREPKQLNGIKRAQLPWKGVA